MEEKRDKTGIVVQVIGPVVDVKFQECELPEIYTAIRITSEGFDVKTPVDIVLRSSSTSARTASAACPCIRPTASRGG